MENNTFKLVIPSKPDYISVARLTSSSIANIVGFSIDDIDDIRVSIAEACINALNKSPHIEIKFTIYEDKLSMMVSNVITDKNKETELGILIIKSLMDQTIFSDKGVEMIKYIEDDNI